MWIEKTHLQSVSASDSRRPAITTFQGASWHYSSSQVAWMTLCSVDSPSACADHLCRLWGQIPTQGQSKHRGMRFLHPMQANLADVLLPGEGSWEVFGRKYNRTCQPECWASNSVLVVSSNERMRHSGAHPTQKLIPFLTRTRIWTLKWSLDTNQEVSVTFSIQYKNDIRRPGYGLVAVKRVLVTAE